MKEPKTTWRDVTVTEVATMTDCVNRTAPVVDYETPFKMIRTTNIRNGRVDTSNVKYVTEEVYLRWIRRGAPAVGDVLLTREAPLGEVGIVRQHDTIFLGQRIVQYRAKPAVLDARFLYYCLQGHDLQGQIRGFGSGATVEHMRLPDCQSLRLRIPHVSVQHKIAGILSAYDDLIENNTRRIAILEAMTKAIYREWFVEFRFPGHENVKLVDSPLGKIPDGWKVVTLQDACHSVIDGDWIETKDQGGDAYRLLQVSNIGIGCFVETGNYRYISQETFDHLRCQEVKQGQILISRMPKPIGRAWLVTEMPWRMITAVDVAIATAHPDRSTAHFLIAYLNSPEHIETAEKHATGTTRARVSRSSLSGLRLVLPPLPIQRSFSKASEDGYTLTVALRKKNQVLRKTRDLLLPKLISGQLDMETLDIEIGSQLVEAEA